MADESTKQDTEQDTEQGTRTYYLAADGMRLKGRRYKHGDPVELPPETGDRLVTSGSLVTSRDDLPAPVGLEEAATAGMHPVAAEGATIDAAQSIDEHGEVKPASFGHPDRVAEAERVAEERAHRADATRPGSADGDSTSDGDGADGGPADTAETKPAARRRTGGK